MRIVIVAILFLSSYSLQAQNGPDKDYLDSLLFERVNHYRLQHNQAKIFISDSLTKVAQEHSSYMLEKNQIEYSNTKKKTGECNTIIEVEADEMVEIEIVDAIINRWLNSPGHAKLILGEFFLYGGGSISFSKTDTGYRYYACFMISYWP